MGKFLTVYPPTESKAVEVAEKLHDLTREFVSISVPFDNQFCPDSNVFYRYGGFADIELTDCNGVKLPAIENTARQLVYDDRLIAVPDWLPDPFRAHTAAEQIGEGHPSPLSTTYRVFSAITQRGKGGTYRAVDLSSTPPRLCVVKEGRRHGEADWNGQDGRALVENEYQNLVELKETYGDCPTVFDAFESDANFYLVMEYVEGESLQKIMMRRRRRFTINEILKYASRIAELLQKIRRAGWVWNDCKPANIIVTKTREMRAVDFENAHRSTETARFKWATRGYSNLSESADDVYGFGALMYVLITGRLYDGQTSKPIKRIRRNVPQRLVAVVEDTLSGRIRSLTEIQCEIDALIRLASSRP